jgi:glyoxylase-like metal-dependent hydrolase (beta-lactamase superfamily II)
MITGHFRLDVNESNAFIVGCEETGDALLIDAAEFPARMAGFLESHHLKLTQVFITHAHYDHIAGLEKILAKYPVTVYSGQDAVAGHATTRVGAGDTISVGNTPAHVISLPGHASEQIGLVMPGMVFTGDALFAGSVGGTFTDQNRESQLEAIRTQILSLPGGTLIHTGHGPSSTVDVEKRHNPFFA